MHEIDRVRYVAEINQRFPVENDFADPFGVDTHENYAGENDNRNEIRHGKSHGRGRHSHNEEPDDVFVQIFLAPADAVELIEQHAEKKAEEAADETVVIGHVQFVLDACDRMTAADRQRIEIIDDEKVAADDAEKNENLFPISEAAEGDEEERENNIHPPFDTDGPRSAVPAQIVVDAHGMDEKENGPDTFHVESVGVVGWVEGEIGAVPEIESHHGEEGENVERIDAGEARAHEFFEIASDVLLERFRIDMHHDEAGKKKEEIHPQVSLSDEMVERAVPRGERETKNVDMQQDDQDRGDSAKRGDGRKIGFLRLRHRNRRTFSTSNSIQFRSQKVNKGFPPKESRADFR